MKSRVVTEKFLILCILGAFALLSTVTAASGSVVVLDDLQIVPRAGMPRVLGSAVDVDKANLGANIWYDDTNTDGDHDPGEPFAAVADSGWTNAQTVPDLSCWLASACNMLEQGGWISNGAALYADYALNGVQTGGGVLTVDDGGLQEHAISQWTTLNPAAGASLTMDIQWCSDTVSFTSGVSAWEDLNPRTVTKDYLADDWQVGIGMWPLLSSAGDRAGGHALTMQDILNPWGFDCTDSDRDSDWDSAGDVNTYDDLVVGPASSGGHLYYGWVNDFYYNSTDPDWYYPLGDVGYLCAIKAVPEPSTFAIWSLLGAVGVLGWRHRRKA